MTGYVLSYIRPDKTAAILGKALTLELAAATLAQAISAARSERQELRDQLLVNHHKGYRELLLTEHHEGWRLRIDPADNPPNVCPCCSGLVRPGDHAMAGTEDAYCLGCFTWDRNVPQCLPQNSAHPNPWTIDTTGARWHLNVVFEDDEGETSSDYRYSSDEEQPDEDTAALAALPGLTQRQILSVTITPIPRLPEEETKS